MVRQHGLGRKAEERRGLVCREVVGNDWASGLRELGSIFGWEKDTGEMREERGEQPDSIGAKQAREKD